ncbi:MAG TPA: DUF488 domain-containing protein [Urbifossiella sp.]|jgi:uncharacterized protein (DUF488 family)|nr:DUF488 domain-containing protein [Urbifossiella sp.]
MTAAFTIGYGGRTPDEFTRLLTAHGVATVVDVRLRPDKASMGSYALAKDADKGIAGLLGRAGVGYLSLPELGNLFLAYPDWPTRYADFLDRAGPLLFDRLVEIPGPVSLLCAEKRVAECHRRAVADYLTRTRGWAFTHIV